MTEINETPEDTLQFGYLIDSTEEEFRKAVKHKDFGFVSSVKNLTQMTYLSATQMVEELKKKEQTPEIVKTIEEIYSALFRLEGKALLCAQIMEERRPTPKTDI